ncbi:MAG: dihydropteroate synthase [Pseudomonadota bacterium]|nr:dihydropteroate synthase [Pseudomonadota bacterium]
MFERSLPKVMGIVNVTPDSFSDGGSFFDHRAALDHAHALIAVGADILDIGGESTRPGAEPVPALEELRRVVPLIQAIRATSAIPISIDTTKPEVANAAMAAGASIWNDVMALQADGAPEAAAELGCDVVLMHMQGEPRTMQDDPRYDDVVAEVTAFLAARAEAAMAAGVARERITLDPGIGFGKTVAHNLALIAGLPSLTALGFPVLVGASRKRMIRTLDPTAVEADDRLGGSLALALAAVERGATTLRVHDVRETVQALAVWGALPG